MKKLITQFKSLLNGILLITKSGSILILYYNIMKKVILFNLFLLLIIIVGQHKVLKLSLPFYSILILLIACVNGFLDSYIEDRKKNHLLPTFKTVIVFGLGILINNLAIPLKTIILNKFGDVGTILFEIVLFGSLLLITNLQQFKHIEMRLTSFKDKENEDKFKDLDIFLDEKYSKIKKISIDY